MSAPKHPPLTAAQRAAFPALYRAGLPTREIAARLGCHWRQVVGLMGKRRNRP